jgi:acetyl coenzyme A synthetase (ADP forming)-like protein
MLSTFFNPRSVAVIGASREPDKLGHLVLSNIIEYGFSGAIYPINPKADEILDLKAYPSVLQVPDPIDLAVILIPARFVAPALEECGQKGVKGAIIISAGFREVGGEGVKLEKELIAIARKYNMRLMGPNCLGLIDTLTPLNASFAVGMPGKGKISFMSQSGALCTAVLDVALAEDVGFSHFVSLGNKADLNEIDFMEAWSEDPDSRVIMGYLEGIADGGRFIRVAQQVTKHKPIIAIKSGTTNAGSRAVSSHTGTLAGSERAYEAAFRQAGVLRAGSVQELFDYAVVFARQPLPTNDHLAIITNAGGPGIMATDACERAGLSLASLSHETMEALRAGLPAAASVLNPVDVLGDALADRYRLAIELVLQDENVGGIIVILTPQFVTQIEETARVVGELAGKSAKPVLACFMGEANIGQAVKILTKYRVPNYPVPERAVAAMVMMVRQYRWQQEPLPEIRRFNVDHKAVEQIFARVRAEGRVTIGDAEARAILQAYGIPIPASELAASAEEAIEIAEKIGYPVVMKVASPDILHKTDIGGVKLNITSPGDVRDAFDLLVYRATRFMPEATIWGCLVQQMVKGGKEVIVGMNCDPQFGPLVMFGLGGIYVEVLKDVAFRIAPFSEREAQEMIREIRSYNLLRGVRGEAPSDLDAVADTLLRLSQLVTDFPEVVEMDINPLMVFPAGQGVMGIDMRLVLSS